MKRRLAVTGAMGVIAGRLLPDLSKEYELSLLDLRDEDREGRRYDGVSHTDLMSEDRSALVEVLRGVDTVIHSGFVRAATEERRFEAEYANVRMAYNVFQSALDAGVRRVVCISSNHAADFYEQHILTGKLLSISPDTPAYSDNYYGWAKVAYEALGFAFATGNVNGGRRLPNVQIRIGAPRETDILSCKPGDLRRMKRCLGAYLSLRDEVQLITRSIETENIDNEWGVPFQIFYGVSGNTFNFWSIENARRVIGYAPEDDSSVRFASEVRRITEGLA